MTNFPPCFYCEEPSEYSSVNPVQMPETNELELISVCKKHFDFSTGVG